MNEFDDEIGAGMDYSINVAQTADDFETEFEMNFAEHVLLDRSLDAGLEADIDVALPIGNDTAADTRLDTDALVINDVAVKFDFDLGDDELEIELIIESLEDQYNAFKKNTLLDTDDHLPIQSIMEWMKHHSTNIPALFRYLRTHA